MRVVVTRPEPGLSRSCERIAALGLTPVRLPLFEAVPLESGRKTVSAHMPTAYIATSAAAVRAAGEEADRSIPIWTVGPATAGAARAAGFENVIEGPGDAAGLAGRIVAASPPGDLLYLAGRRRTPALETALAAAGLPLAVVEVYDMRPVDHDAAGLRRLLLQPAPAGAVLLYSANAAERFGHIVAKAGLIGPPGAAFLLCLSAAVAARLPPELAGRALVADAPDEAAMMRRLEAIRNQGPRRPV